MAGNKSDRLLEILYMAMNGRFISVSRLAEEYGVSARSISRDISSIKNFLAEHRDITGNAELEYSNKNHSYILRSDGFLTAKESLCIIKVLIGTRAFSLESLRTILKNINSNILPSERSLLTDAIKNEMDYYNEIQHECPNVIDLVWQLYDAINKKQLITVRYFKLNRDYLERKIMPISVIFMDYYFYLIAAKADDPTKQPHFFRVDRIKYITLHRERFETPKKLSEGDLRARCPFMFAGETRHICFEFSGPSVQDVLDRLPTARITYKTPEKYTLEAIVSDEGIKHYLLSQGSCVKVLSPASLVAEIEDELSKMTALYNMTTSNNEI